MVSGNFTFPMRSSEFAKWLNSFECSSKTLNLGCLTDCSRTKFQKCVKNVFKNPVVLRFRRCNLLIIVNAAFDPVFTLNKNHKSLFKNFQFVITQQKLSKLKAQKCNRKNWSFRDWILDLINGLLATLSRKLTFLQSFW